jgi:hypothetical protein
MRSVEDLRAALQSCEQPPPVTAQFLDAIEDRAAARAHRRVLLPAIVAACVAAIAVLGMVLGQGTSQHRAPSATTSSVPPAPAACSLAGKEAYEPRTQHEFRTRVVGTWLACSQPSIFNTDDAGLQIDANGHWAKLVRDSSGRLLASSGYENAGTWQVEDDSAANGRPTFQINFRVEGSGTVITIPKFVGTATRMDNNGFWATTYVPTSEPVIPAG